MKIIDKSTSESEILDILFKNRHVNSKDIDEFLKPTNPSSLSVLRFGVNQKTLDKAVKIIKQFIKDKKNILIYGDYDVDGITATAILWQVLHNQGALVTPFVPDREADGYGIRAKSFFDFQKQKNITFDLLITVDNGIVANLELQKIIDAGTQIVVVDHHVADKKLPSIITTVHSTKISGSALSWLLAKQFDYHADLGLAALGTVADCLPLNDINRNIVFHGLQSLRLNPNCGIKKLIEVSGVKPDSISTYDLGFVLGPRINAVGRLANPTDALRLLCCSSPIQASKYSQILDSFNKDRQTLQLDSITLAKNKIPKDFNEKVVFVADKSFHPGVIGLISGRLTEQYYLPSIVISINEEIAKGSCRSIKELNIIESLRQCSNELVELGGHAGAAGFSIETKKIPKFQKEITKIINEKLKDIELKPSVYIDAEMKLSAVTIKNCKLMQKLEPFGIENPEPIFLFKDIKITQKRLLGQKQEHLKLKVDDPETKSKENILAGIDAIAFKKGELDKHLKIGDLISFTARLNLNIWNSNTSPQLIIKDIL